MTLNSLNFSLDERLVQACLDFNLTQIDSLLKAGANPNFLTTRDVLENKPYYEPYTKAPLDILLSPYLLKSDLEVAKAAKMLLDHGANPQGGTSGDNLSTPLHEAVYANNFQLTLSLIEKGANVNSHDSDFDYTPLHIACGGFGEFASPELVEYLIQQGADLNAQDGFGKTPGIIIVSNAQSSYLEPKIIPLFEILTKYGSDFSITDSEKNSTLSLIQNRPDLKLAVIEGLTKSEPLNTNNKLILEIVKLLPQFGLTEIKDLTKADNKVLGTAILDQLIETHLISIYPDNVLEQKLIQATFDLNLDKMTSLLEQGADPDFLSSREHYSYTNIGPLHFLSCGLYSPNRENVPAAMKLLLDNGANPNIINDQGDTPLYILTELSNNFHSIDYQLKLFNILLNHGADMTQKNHEGIAPADHLVGKSNFNLLIHDKPEEVILNLEQEDIQLIAPLIEDNAEFIRPIIDTQLVTTTNQTTLVLEDIIEDDTQNTFFVEPPSVNQEVVMTEEVSTCAPYEGYVPLIIMQWLNLEKPCDSNGAVV
jgi:ankyrin repeat protein